MGTVRLDIEYDGTDFSGWATQPGLRTVQGELESALARILREAAKLTVAGRTDTGVHAWGQVASFETTAELPADLARRLNGVGSEQIAVTAADCGRGRVRRPSRRQVPHLLLPSPGPAHAQPLRAGPRPVVAAPDRPQRPESLRGGPPRHP